MMQPHLRRFISDERGNFAIITAGLMMLVIGCAALGVDLGSIFADRRRTQSAADLAAIVAASNLTNATNAAIATVTANNYPAAPWFRSNLAPTPRIRRLPRKPASRYPRSATPTRRA
jgi:Flp pilus assembly protein TadG